MGFLKNKQTKPKHRHIHKILILRNQFIQKNTLHLQRAELYSPLEEWKPQTTGGDETNQLANKKCVEAMSLRESEELRI